MSTREVVLDGGSPWGFRMHGGVDVHQPLRISRVNPGSKAAQRGIREGDLISSINGQSTKTISNADAHSLLRNSGSTLRLGLNEGSSGSPKRRVHKVAQDNQSDASQRTNLTSETLSLSSTSTINRILSNVHNKETSSNGYQSSKDLLRKFESESYDNDVTKHSSSQESQLQRRDPQERDIPLFCQRADVINIEAAATTTEDISISDANQCSECSANTPTIVERVTCSDGHNRLITMADNGKSKRQRRGRGAANRRRSKKNDTGSDNSALVNFPIPNDLTNEFDNGQNIVSDISDNRQSREQLSDESFVNVSLKTEIQQVNISEQTECVVGKCVLTLCDSQNDTNPSCSENFEIENFVTNPENSLNTRDINIQTKYSANKRHQSIDPFSKCEIITNNTLEDFESNIITEPSTSGSNTSETELLSEANNIINLCSKYNNEKTNSDESSLRKNKSENELKITKAVEEIQLTKQNITKNEIKIEKNNIPKNKDNIVRRSLKQAEQIVLDDDFLVEESLLKNIESSSKLDNCAKISQKIGKIHIETPIHIKQTNEQVGITKRYIQSQSIVEVTETTMTLSETHQDEDSYRVDSPPPANPSKKGSIPKSRSLDDDEDKIQITEVTDEISSEKSDVELVQNSADIVDTDSDVEWETAAELRIAENSKANVGSLSIIGHYLEETPVAGEIISPEDELSLRQFLESLNLITSSTDQLNRNKKLAENKDLLSPESVSERKAKKRAMLENYFLPAYQNPRFLHVIDEEDSDLSDKDNCEKKISKLLSANKLSLLKDNSDWFDTYDDSVFFNNSNSIVNMAELVETKIINLNDGMVQHCDWKTDTVESSSGAEVVFLEDSSSSQTPSDVLDREDTDEADAEDEDSREDTLTYDDFVVFDSEQSDLEIMNITNQTKIQDRIEEDSSNISKNDCINETLPASHLTPPPTPDNLTSKIEQSNYEHLTPKVKVFVKQLLSLLSERTNDELMYEYLKQAPLDEIPREMKETITDLLSTHDLADKNRNFFLSNIPEKLDTVMEVKVSNTEAAVTIDVQDEEEKLNEEFELLYSSLKNNQHEDLQVPSYSPLISRPDSCNSVCSSRSTSQSTARYIPACSSLSDIAAILREEQHIENETSMDIEDKINCELKSLRELCINTILSLPFGPDILEELANVSEKIENLTNQSPVRFYQSPTNYLFAPQTERRDENECTSVSDQCLTSHSNNTDDTPYVLPVSMEALSEMSNREKWTGIPTNNDPSLLVYFSPSQRNYINTHSKQSSKTEADDLLDMHYKFIERRSYNETLANTPTNLKNMQISQSTPNIDKPKINEYSKSESEGSGKYENHKNNRLLTIIRNTAEKRAQLDDLKTNIYLNQKAVDENQNKHEQNSRKKQDIFIDETVNFGSVTLPRVHKQINQQSLMRDRLKARHLSEWMDLARRKSASDYDYTVAHLSQCTDFSDFLSDIPQVSTNNQQSTVKTSVERVISHHTEDAKLRPHALLSRQLSENILKTNNNTINDDTNRRFSLPEELHERQLNYILEKEKEIEREIEILEKEKRLYFGPFSREMDRGEFDTIKYKVSSNRDITTISDFEEFKKKLSEKCNSRPKSMPVIPGEFFRQAMYDEYMHKVAEREERKQQKVIKISCVPGSKDQTTELNTARVEIRHPFKIENEFMDRVKERRDKLGINVCDGDESDVQVESKDCKIDPSEPILVFDGSKIMEGKQLPKHLQEFVQMTTTKLDRQDEHNIQGVWSPGQSASAETDTRRRNGSSTTTPAQQRQTSPHIQQKDDEGQQVVWTPRSAGASPTPERKEFRPVNFESPVLSRKNKAKSEELKTSELESPIQPPWEASNDRSPASILSASLDRRLTSSQSAPASGFSTLQASRLPRAQNPTITLLQKAREGQLPRGVAYLEETRREQRGDDRPPIISPHEIMKNEYSIQSDTESGRKKKMVELGPRKFEGIGPTTRDGMPIVLRSEVKESNQAKWYKRMYETLHKTKDDDEYVTVRYKTRRGRFPYTSTSGYLSEPEPHALSYDSDVPAGKYATLDRRRPQLTREKENYTSSTVPRNTKSSNLSASVKYGIDVYKNQPGRIENYIPGHSSISEKEAKEWWDEVMEIFDGHLEQQKHVPPQSKSFMSHALKESGYESDSTLVFRRRDDTAQQLSPQEQKEVYKNIQRGGDVPLHGLRKPAPERPKESPRRYVENEVTIHYRSPVRHELKEVLSEEELARRQAEAMRRIYQEERRRKYLQELQDMNSRRHTDNFTPSQKSPIPLNRYDDFDDNTLTKQTRSRDRTPEARLVARALFNFVGQSSRELTFKKGDIIYVRRQIDRNWYEGEHNAMIGLFPFNYVEIIPFDGLKTTLKKSHEGQARAKFNFIAQTHLELSLAKGEMIILTRRVDENWFEGRIGVKKGIFPVSYVDVLQYPSDTIEQEKPVAAPAAHSLLLNGTSGGKQSMGSHHYQPEFTHSRQISYHHAKPVTVTPTGQQGYGSLTRQQKTGSTTPTNLNQTLHIDTQSEPIPYRAMYKYRPQNEDELELQEGDVVYVLEKCDDGWYVGSSQRSGAFGTFPGNYVEKI